MFRKFHEKLKEHDEGFTLIELLVVILIIAILAAIAIPVFLRQREKGWVSQMESALKNATTSAESYATGRPEGNYAGLTLAKLQDEGFEFASTVEISDAKVVEYDSDNAYCIEVSHASLEDPDIEPMAISSEVTTPQQNSTCGATGLVGPTTTTTP